MKIQTTIGSSIMEHFWIITISCVILGKISLGQSVNLSFPENFTIGAATSSYQVEGAWNVSDKSENIWDRWTHTNPESIADGSNGDDAAKFYYKYKEDVQLIKSIGLDFFRFSIAWSRILPTGYTNKISLDGIQFYKNLTKELVANGIEPVVTLYHLDHPQVLEDFGGWTNELMVDRFVRYARIMFKELGDSVKIWITFSEPALVCPAAYDESSIHLAPDKNLTGIGKYLCMHNILKAHATTYHMYDDEFRASQQGEIGIVAQCTDFVSKNSGDTESAETAFQFECGWQSDPIYKGDYPEIMKTRIAMISEAQGYQTSRLPEFSKEWKTFIKGTSDYFGLNFYTSKLVSPDPDEELGIYNSDYGLIESVNSSWPATRIPGLSVTPTGFGDVLRRIRDKYGNPRVRVMENGYLDDGELEDYNRIRFHYDHLIELLKAIKLDNCRVESYAIWTFMDDFEWISGYTVKFGIFRIDRNDTDRSRTARLSASWWKSVLESRELQPVPTSHDSSILQL